MIYRTNNPVTLKILEMRGWRMAGYDEETFHLTRDDEVLSLARNVDRAEREEQFFERVERENQIL